MRPPLHEMPSASRTGSVGHDAGPPTTVATLAGELSPAAAGVGAGEFFLHVRFLQRQSAGSPPASRTAPSSVGQGARGRPRWRPLRASGRPRPRGLRLENLFYICLPSRAGALAPRRRPARPQGLWGKLQDGRARWRPLRASCRRLPRGLRLESLFCTCVSSHAGALAHCGRGAPRCGPIGVPTAGQLRRASARHDPWRGPPARACRGDSSAEGAATPGEQSSDFRAAQAPPVAGAPTEGGVPTSAPALGPPCPADAERPRALERASSSRVAQLESAADPAQQAAPLHGCGADATI